MSFGIGDVLTVVDLIKRAVDVYNTIEEVPGEVEELELELENLTKPLSSLLSYLENQAGKNSGTASAKWADQDRKQLSDTLKKSSDDCSQALKIFTEYKSKHLGYLGNVELTTRFESVASLFYKYGKANERVQKLADRIRKRQLAIQNSLQVISIKSYDEVLRKVTAISDQLSAESAKGAQENAALEQEKNLEINLLKKLLIKALEEARRAKARESIVMERRLVPEAKSTGPKVVQREFLPLGQTLQVKSKEKHRSKTPDPPESQKLQPPQNRHRRQASEPPPLQSLSLSARLPVKKHTVLFVDPNNVGRSLLAHAILELTSGWISAAVGSKDASPIQAVASAGFAVQNGCECQAEIEALKYRYPSYRIKLQDVGSKANMHAVSPLFFDDGSAWRKRSSTRDWIESLCGFWTPRGMARRFFHNYDYILCFTNREYSNLQLLRQALVDKDGPDACPDGKARILHLGHWLGKKDDGTRKEILSVGNGDWGKDEAAWNGKILQIKQAVDGFINQELKFEYPK